MTIRVGDWKLIDALGSGGFSEPRKRKPKAGEAPGQLYNLKEDPAEKNNRYLERSDIVTRLRKELEAVKAPN